ncbi:alpha/beta hydrolase [Allofranklinella schreckenbergeri]|uniref:Alpha/beta hydrolase n=1 Tax=Allofranklinella schreckenbergeri TaxID=1076744 RepID=A0A3M6Q0Z0_9BURK|nr:alpha/beta hydrolase-fold protein [Allofranklinella schreckenbergeri]RMW96140.1 alpha/beta hydrolase [Allofranklinella schreckenbergeri]
MAKPLLTLLMLALPLATLAAPQAPAQTPPMPPTSQTAPTALPAPPVPPPQAAAATAAPSSPLGAAMPARLPGAHAYSVRAKATGRPYRIQVSAIGRPPAQGYPVLYVLDGDALFPVVSMAAQGMAMRADENGTIPMLIVGVGYDDAQLLDIQARAQDYTPPAPDLANTGDRWAKQQGGADVFLQFLTQELQPAIAQSYPADPSRQALMGHSYGGLFALYAMLQQPQHFQVYIASSPSLWWNGGYLHQVRERTLPVWQAASALQNTPSPAPAGSAAALALPTGLHISMGSYEQTPSPRIDAQSPRARMMQERGQVTHARQFAQAMQKALPDLPVQFAQYPQATHATAALHAVIDGLRFASDCWQTPNCQPPAIRHKPH